LMKMKSLVRTVMLVGLAALLCLPGFQKVKAAGVVGDGTPESCTYAAFSAALVGGGTVTFNCGPNPHTIDVATSVIDSPVTIDGGDLIILNGGGTLQIFLVIGAGDLTLQNIILTNGNFGNGGGIFNEGKTRLENVTITNSKADGGSGGAIYNKGELQITGGIFSGNQATMNGGGIYNANGTVTLQNLTIMDNQAANGAGVYQSGGSTTIGNSLFHRNGSTNHGGGVYNVSGALSLTNVTFSGNIASYGGGLYNSDQSIHMNVTYYLNQADIGGAIFNSAGSNQLTNTILAGSLSRDATSDSLNCDNAGTAVASNGYNLASDNSCALTNTADQPATDPILGPLQDNGGTTYTHDLLPGSPAIDAGTDAGCPATDQRGKPRPLGASCDIGAVEYGEVLYAIYLPMIMK
jgi:hypothetical protein